MPDVDDLHLVATQDTAGQADPDLFALLAGEVLDATPPGSLLVRLVRVGVLDAATPSVAPTTAIGPTPSTGFPSDVIGAGDQFAILVFKDVLVGVDQRARWGRRWRFGR